MKACLENAARLEREIARKGGCGVAAASAAVCTAAVKCNHQRL